MNSELSPKITPMFEQYIKIKKNYPDALLFYRMGDFYELFFDDAKIAAQELQIALTSRNPNAPVPVPMCGVPWHAVDSYVNQLINKGYKIAFCDQIENPQEAKGLVRRAVTRVYTAGTITEDESLEPKAHTYLGALFWNEQNDHGGLTWADVSTGSWTGLELKKKAELWQWALKIAPRELLYPENLELPQSLKTSQEIQLVPVPLRTHFDFKQAKERILSAQGVNDLSTLDLEKTGELVRACGALLLHIQQTQMQNARQLEQLIILDLGRYLLLDEVTEKNLELFRRLDGRKGAGTLRHVLDRTQTSMGGRLLEERIHNPWRELIPIQSNLDAVEWFFQHEEARSQIREALKDVYDLERLSTRIALNRTSPRDFLAVRNSLKSLPAVRAPLEKEKNQPDSLQSILDHWDNFDDFSQKLDKALAENPPQTITEGGLFKNGFHAELDDLLDLIEHGENKVQALLAKEQKKFPKLKLGSNRIFGYYFELSKSAGGKVPDYFIPRQTLANATRFSTPELKELEERILAAAEQRKSLEYKLFQILREELARARPRLILMADMLAHLDFWQSLAETAARYNWTRPHLREDQEIHIIEGRHPVIEAVLGEESFVPNDLHMDAKRRLLLITGPNMSGKSTVLRQTALICILAQMGSFVPAKKADVGICDRIFSRVGASDNLAQGQSTFMVEMMETARILRQSTKKSLVILDEIGRGTSTFDGMSLAWAVAEDLARRCGGTIRTLFATHYHELTALEGKIAGVCTMNVAIREWKGEIIFLRRLIPGPADRSYGIEVARLAGMPQTLVQRAREILTKLERHRPTAKNPDNFLPGFTPPSSQQTIEEKNPLSPPEHPLLVALRDLDPNSLTPLDALKRLIEWKQLWGTSA